MDTKDDMAPLDVGGVMWLPDGTEETRRDAMRVVYPPQESKP
jgi:hypothetical protein